MLEAAGAAASCCVNSSSTRVLGRLGFFVALFSSAVVFLFFSSVSFSKRTSLEQKKPGKDELDVDVGWRRVASNESFLDIFPL